jgi:hypothetical protein
MKTQIGGHIYERRVLEFVHSTPARALHSSATVLREIATIYIYIL